MILDAVFKFFAAIIDGLLGLFPAWDLDMSRDVTSVLAKMTPFGNLVGWLNQYLPIREAVYGLGMLLTFWVAAHVFHLVSWVLTKLHVAGGT